MREIKGRVAVTLKGGRANERRRSLYWSVASLVVPILNDLHNLTLDEDDLHDITRDKFKMYDEKYSGVKRYWSTSNRAMNEADRAAYTDKALRLWSVWTGVDVTTLREEALRDAA